MLLLINLLSAVYVIAPTEHLLSTCNWRFALLLLNRSIVGDEEICLADVDEAECIGGRSYTTLAAVAAQKRRASYSFGSPLALYGVSVCCED